MKTSFSQGRNAGLLKKSLMALAVVFGAALGAMAQDYPGQVTFPGLDGTYNSNPSSNYDRPSYNTNDRYDNFNDNTTPSFDTLDRNRFEFRGSPGERTRTRVGPDSGLTPYETRRPAYNNTNDRYDFENDGYHDKWDPNYNTRTPRYDVPTRFETPRYDAPVPRTQPIDPVLEDFQKAQQKISFRYQNPVLLRFLKSLTVSQSVALYREINGMIDQRHLEPSTYAERTSAGVRNLINAINNADFRQFNRMSASTQGIDSFKRTAEAALQQNSIRSRSEAEQVINRISNEAKSQLGLPAQVVVMEFVFGATETLDKYSAFVPDDVRTGPSAAAVEDSVVGIGVEVKANDRGLLVERVLNGGPAHEAGLQAGDVIVNVDGRTIVGMSLSQAVDLIGGPSGSRISLGVERTSRIPFAISMIRRRVEIQTVNDVRMLDSTQGVAYMRLDKFAEKSSAEMDQALWSLHQQGMRSLILDLRGNPGGLLTGAVDISNKFLPQGVIVSTKGRLQQDNMSAQADRTKTWKTPLVVLVDENSASASEIFAAAIQENGRGVIVGRKSYGKGTVQTHFPLTSVSGALRLTTAKFYSPKNREMADSGVTPDILVNGFELDSRTLSNGDKDIQAALRIAPTSELARMSEQQAQPRTPGYSLSGLSR
ncbi:MAG TPA: S41 family peptidase [Planctomycetaceae bacterium]|nr:S41 family peptidase [Planctomycetaceae bacterium]